MSRNFSNSLLFESALDGISVTNTLLHETSTNLFSPLVEIVEDNCATLLGKPMFCSFRAVGLIEVATGLTLNESRIDTLISQGKAYVDVRTLDTCISSNGVCRTCMTSSRPTPTLSSRSLREVGFNYKIVPEIVLDNSRILGISGQGYLDISYSVDQFDKLYVYSDNILVDPSKYSITGHRLTFLTPLLADTIFIIKYIVFSNIQYYNWLADTYCGSLLGIKSIQNLGLPIKKLLLQQSVNNHNVESLNQRLNVSTLLNEEDYVKYLPSIKDPLEKAIFIILLNSIFLS
jgi:hypothetical protein